MIEFTSLDSEQREITDGISLRPAAEQTWDVIVIGAGPAGSLAARLLSERGRSVLLIEAKAFPRNKVCGGCLNARTLKILSHVGLGRMPIDAGGVPLTKFQLFLPHRTASLAIPAGVSLSRSRFDQELLSAALDAGCQLLSEATASVLPYTESSRRTILVQQGGEQVHLTAACVVCADGLRRSSVRQLPELAARVASHSYVGVGTTILASQISPETAEQIPPGTIRMALGKDGYVGLARMEQEGLSIAAAVNPAAVKAKGSAAVIAGILEPVGLACPGWDSEIIWAGTTPLTSSAGRVASERLFVVGDAAGYVEPFTGEGIAAALESAWLATPFVDQAVNGWGSSLARAWETTYDRSIRRRQWICRGLTWLLRHPSMAERILPWILQFPAAARPLLSRINDTKLATLPLAENAPCHEIAKT